MSETTEFRGKMLKAIEDLFKEHGEIKKSDIETIIQKEENDHTLDVNILKNGMFSICIDGGHKEKYYYDQNQKKVFLRRANKSAVTRIIISNYDSEKIKEIKVLYRKQGGVDTIYINEMVLDESTNKISFIDVEGNPNGFNVTTAECVDGIISFEKKDKYTGEITRKFKISGEFVKTHNHTMVKVCLKDELEGSSEKRKNTAHTERKLIPVEQIKNYAFLLNKDESQIDSLTIYKAKRFMTYRSNMEFYYNFMNDFFMYNDKNGDRDSLRELYKVGELKVEDPEKYKKYVEYFASKIEDRTSIFIENHNNRIRNNPEKAELQGLKVLEYSVQEIKEDVSKIIEVFSDVRHNLMHFNYTFFEKLFTGNDDSLTLNLELNLFEKLFDTKRLKDESRNTYLETDDKIRLMKKNINAKDIYDFYNKLCNRSNGFNKFINSFFATDGKENMDLKQIINQDFDQSLEGIKKYLDGLKPEEKENNELLQKRYDDFTYARGKIQEAYAWDIHLCPFYKKLYNQHKNLVKEQGILISNPHDSQIKKKITKKNKEIRKIKIEMERLSKINAKIRLEYKMRLAFGLLYEDFNKMDIDYFKKNFDLTKEEEIRKHLLKGTQYLLVSGENGDIEELNLKSIIKQEAESLESNDSLFDDEKENNLFKMYTLVFLLLPTELRGDFLGYVKKHYYETKHVDYISEQIEDKMEFFNKMRLFEKNIKKFEVITYSLSEYGELKEKAKKICRLIEEENKQNHNFKGSYVDNGNLVMPFDKNLITPILKFYQKVYHLHSMVEIQALVGVRLCKGKDSLQEVFEIAKFKGNYNYNSLLRIWLNEKFLFAKPEDLKIIVDDFCKKRNKIAHISFKDLFDEKLFDKNEKMSFGDMISASIEFIYKYQLDSSANLGINLVNDFYMTLDNYLFHLKKYSYDNNVNGETADSLKKDDEYLKSLGFENLSDGEIFEKFVELNDFKISPHNLNKLENYIKNIQVKLPKEKPQTKQYKNKKEDPKTVQSLIYENWEQYQTNINGAVRSVGNRLLGIYKRRMGKVVKDFLIQAITQNEKRLVNLYVVDKTNLDKTKKIKPIICFIEKPAKDKDGKMTVTWLSNENKCDCGLEIKINKEKPKEVKKKVFDSIALCHGQEVKRFNFEDSYVHRIDYIKK